MFFDLDIPGGMVLMAYMAIFRYCADGSFIPFLFVQFLLIYLVLMGGSCDVSCVLRLSFFSSFMGAFFGTTSKSFGARC